MKSTKVSPGVKARLEDLKTHLKEKDKSIKSESDVIAFLEALYDEFYPKLTLPQFDKVMENARQIERQGVI